MGTLSFARRAFPGRRSITLGELRHFCRLASRVRCVAIYKLSQIPNILEHAAPGSSAIEG